MPINAVEATIADEAPWSDRVTDYDHAHNSAYLRLLDAAFEGASHHEMARIILGIDPRQEPDRAALATASHLTRAFWMMRVGWKQILD
jgi:hypothetical protein